MFLAMQTGELDGQPIGLSSLKAGQPALWSEGKVRALVQFARSTRLADLPDVPTGRELAKNGEALAMIEFAELPFFSALPFTAPPDIPADRAGALRAAFMATMKDPSFIEGARRLALDVSPIDGDAVRALIAKAATTPKGVIERYKLIVGN
jgi:tripartite-type tricarboxylate transporter receptor subunit TctC